MFGFKTRVLIAAFIYAFIAIPESSAAPKSCQMDIPAVSVKHVSYEGVVKINNGHSSSQLAQKFSNQHKLSRKAGWVTRGLTKTGLESRIEVVVTYRQIGRNQFCVGLQTVSSRIGYRLFNVYVAREFRPGSCEYRTTMAHELNHVAIYRDQLRQYDPHFERRIKGVSAGLRPVLSNSVKSGHTFFLKRINSEVKILFTQLNKETDILQGRLDTPQNYRREQALCPSAGRSLK